MPNTKYINKTGPKTPWTEKGLNSTKYDIGLYAHGPAYPNLYLEVRPKGSKRFLFIYFRNTKQTKISLGVYGPGKTSLKRARQLASEYNDLLANGTDPREHINELKAREEGMPTFFQFVESQLPDIERGLTNEKVRYEWRYRLLDSGYCQLLHSQRIDKIDERAISSVLRPIWIDKKATANKLVVNLREIFRRARSHYKQDIPYNPCENDLLKPLLPRRPIAAKDENHQRSLPWNQMPDFMKRLTQNTSASSMCLQFLIIQGLRTANALGAKWSDLQHDPEPKRYTISGRDMKTKGRFSVPLTKKSLTIIEEMDKRRRLVNCEFIFPNDKGQKLSSHALLMLVRRMTAGTDFDTSVHGLRATLRTWCGEHGYDFVLAETQLDHKVGNAATQAYTHSAQYLQRRLEMVQSWEDFIYSKA